MLSERLKAVSGFAGVGTCAADIGCDHGYVAIDLVESGRFEKCIAMDLRKGPLKAAEENVRAKGLEERIDLRLSDGVDKLQIGEADTVITAGMGGRLIINILKAHPDIFLSLDHFVLQPQSELGEVRHFLHDAGFSLKDEMMVIEDDKFYFLMKFVPGGNDEAYEGMGEEAYEFGPLLLKNKNSLLKEYLIRRKSIISDAVSDIEKALSKNSDNERLKARLIELENLDSLIDKGVRVYET